MEEIAASRLYRPPALEEIPTVDEAVRAAAQHVAGLETEMRRIAVVLRDQMVAAACGLEVRPTNLLVIGPSGGGKSFIVRVLLDIFGMPHVVTGCTKYSDVGYVGANLTSLFTEFWGPRWCLRRHDRVDAARDVAERWGVVVLDEIDKLRSKKAAGGMPQQGREVGEKLQSELLMLVEGDQILAARNDQDRGMPFDTRHVLFIGIGAFEGLSQTVLEHEGHPSDANDRESYLRADPTDIMVYGFKEELVGRFSALVTLPPLTTPALLRVLIEQVYPARVLLEEAQGIELLVPETTLAHIAAQALHAHIGARALGAILDGALWRAKAEAHPGDAIELDAEGLRRQHARVVHRCGRVEAVA